ncbi:dihydrolipoyl dehydrogenase family protein [Terrabacter carboxydivorans]|uniref:FAD-dependent oxidoreductase n=1 Tax=Terrabacter carboxydivorans TaxID=619730 RepID=A0ABP5ZQ32_9MICO
MSEVPLKGQANETCAPGQPSDPKDPWDLVVLGGGTAGMVGAKTAARLGARVLLVERAQLGGDCLWTGCVPSKALLACAEAAAGARRGAPLGVEARQVGVDFAGVMSHVRGAIGHIAPEDSVEALQGSGVHVMLGTGTFTGPRRLDVDGRQVQFRQALLATGAAPALPPIPGLLESSPLTSDTIWALSELPGRLAVLGGGSIGCELGQAFSRLGSQVVLVEGADRILPREDEEAAAVVTDALTDDGVKVRTGVTVVQVVGSSGVGGALLLDDGSRVDFEHLLVAVGRSPRTRNLGLDASGIETDPRGFVVVDARLRTTNAHVWAAGDLTGHPQFTHLAGVHASTAATNAVLGLRRKVSLSAVPRVTFTHPEVAAVGLPTQRSRDGLQVRSWPDSHVDRAVAEGQTTGFTKLVTDRRGRILGATVVGPRAGETLAELTLAVRLGLTTRQLAGTTHPYPTFGDGPWNAVIANVQDQLTRPATAMVIRGLRTARRFVSRR